MTVQCALRELGPLQHVLVTRECAHLMYWNVAVNRVESASTPVGHAVTSLPSSHATQCSSTHVHDPQGIHTLY